jgi:hypothetical protein
MKSSLLATSCYGGNDNGGGVTVTIANSCYGTSVFTQYHYNMPPSPQTP